MYNMTVKDIIMAKTRGLNKVNISDMLNFRYFYLYLNIFYLQIIKKID